MFINVKIPDAGTEYYTSKCFLHEVPISNELIIEMQAILKVLPKCKYFDVTINDIYTGKFFISEIISNHQNGEIITNICSAKPKFLYNKWKEILGKDVAIKLFKCEKYRN